MPIDFETLLHIIAMCKLNFILQSILTPKNTELGTHERLELLRYKFPGAEGRWRFENEI